MLRQKILAVADEPSLLRMLEIGLQSGERDIRTAADGRDALLIAAEWQPDLVLVDALTPGVGWDGVCRRLRETSTAPAILLTARRGQWVVAQALEAGADECVAKPFSIADLRALVQTVLGRSQRLPNLGPVSELACDRGKLKIDFARCLALRDERVIPLGNTQFRLLAYLAANPGRVLPYQEILDEIWGPEQTRGVAALRTHVALLRQRVEENPRRPHLIADVEGLGLQLRARD